MSELPTIVVFSGASATIQNSPPLRTSGAEATLRAQRLAAPAIVYVKAHSAHPLEADAADLYAPPDGYLDEQGGYVELRGNEPPEGTSGVYRVELLPSDGPLLLPYVARQRDGSPWEATGLSALADEAGSRQTFYPDASRIYEEIDRFGLDGDGRGRLLGRLANFRFVRALPSGGYRSEAGARAAGLASPERRGEDYFGYYPDHLRAEPGGAGLARATNAVQDTLDQGGVLGAQWLEGSPVIEETLYWLSLVIDTRVPIVGHAAQRPHGTLSADGDRNIVDGVRYLTSRIWADEEGNDQLGAVLIADEVIYAAREVAKTDARPGNYVATGGHGGIVGSTGVAFGAPVLTYRPVHRHTSSSAVRLRELPSFVGGLVRDVSGELTLTEVPVKGPDGLLLPSCMPAVEIVKYGRYAEACCGAAEVKALVAHFVEGHP
ncbi:MAG: asparaginase domain-containing protein, partial [Acidimicrobiales bacterium]